MRFSAAAASAALLTGAQAIINGVAVPSTIRPGDGFNVIIESSDYIQSVYDVAIAFGYAPGAGYPDSLGEVIDSFYLGPDQSNQLNNFTKWVTLPSTVEQGPGFFTASLMSLWGAVDAPGLTNWNVSVVISNVTSTTYVGSNA